MDTVVGTVDVAGWRWLVVVVGDEQAERMLGEKWQHRPNPATPATACMFYSLVNATTEIAKCHGLRNASRSAREANVSNLWLIRRTESFRRESRIVLLHEDSQGVLLHRTMSARIQIAAWGAHRVDVRSEQLWKLHSTFRAGGHGPHMRCGEPRRTNH